jgi:hypothetical protein
MVCERGKSVNDSEMQKHVQIYHIVPTFGTVCDVFTLQAIKIRHTVNFIGRWLSAI